MNRPARHSAFILLSALLTAIPAAPAVIAQGTARNRPATIDKTDVAIYGATPGGNAAAISAARHGHEVTLVQPTHRIGGLPTCGLSHTDFRSFEALGGTFLDFSQRVERYYREKYGPDSEQSRC